MNVSVFSRYKIKISIMRCVSFHRLSDQHLEIQKTARDFAEAELKPIAAELDKTYKFPAEQMKKLGELGLLGITVSKKWGGLGKDTLALVIAIEEISRGCASTGSMLSIHNCLYANLVYVRGTDEQKKTFVKPFTNGSLGCFALSEPQAGTDVAALETTAKLEGDTFILNGIKAWVTNAVVSKAAVVFATVDKNLRHKGITAFIVPLPHPGVTLGTLDDKLGIRAAPTCNITLRNARIPKENVLGDVGEGFLIAMVQMDRARAGVGAVAIGIAQASMEAALEYSRQRIAFGRPIDKLQAIKMRFAEMAVSLEAARLLVYKAAAMCDEPGRSTKQSCMAKLAASQAAGFVTHNSIQIMGANGYMTNMPAERHFRDARATEIYGGVTDLQKLVVGESVIKEYQDSFHKNK